VEDILERETQSGPCDVEAVRQDDLDPLMGEDMGLGNAGPNGPILAPTNSGKKTTWKKKARSNCIISSEASKSEFSIKPMLTPGKRALQVETEHSLQDQDEPCLKKSRTNGGMKSHESESVEAVEQPCRAQ
jgi:hypothetical protein